MLLPRKVGPFTLMRKVDADAMAESYVAILDAPAGKQVIARRLLSAITRDPARMAQIRARVADLRSARHPALAAVLELVETDGEAYVLEDQVEGAELRRVIDHCARAGLEVPHNVYLEVAVQICNAIEALHSRPGIESGSENVLHLALAPSAVWLSPDGKVTLGRYGLTRSPTAVATQSTGLLPSRVEYLAPEQTHQDQKLSPASDLFSLGAVLYELLALRSMFLADTQLQTIHRVRRAEVTTQLLEVKEILPGLDKVLFRSLSLNPRHRYQRAFVLREDLRGLMAGYSFSDIGDATRAFLHPILDALPPEDGGLFDHSADVSFGDFPSMRESTQDLLGEVPDRSESPMEAPRSTAPPARPQDRVDPLDHAGVLDALSLAGSDLRGDTMPMGLDGPTHPSLDPGPFDRTPPRAEPSPHAFGAGLAAAHQVFAAPVDRSPLPSSSPTFEHPPPSAGPREPASPVPQPAASRDSTLPRPVAAAPPPEISERPPPSRWPWVVAAVVGLILVVSAVVCLGGGGVLGFAALRPDAEPPALPTALDRDPAPEIPSPTEPPPPVGALAVRSEGVAPAAPVAPRAREDAVAGVLDPGEPAPAPAVDLDAWSGAALGGQLDPEARRALEAVPPTDPDFTRAGTLLVMDAKARRDTAARDRWLTALLAQPENKYDAVLLSERALLALERGQDQAALADAKLAEQHWARIPSEVMASRKTVIFETQAVANERLFNASEGGDLARLEASIRSWERYRSHVSSLVALELVARADQRLATLHDLQERLE